MKSIKWSDPELILALRLYYQLPFGKMHRGNKEIIQLANIIERTPSAVAMKLVNFARFDTNLRNRNIKGLVNGSKQDEVIWNEYGSPEILEEKSNELIETINKKELFELFMKEEIIEKLVIPDTSKSSIVQGRRKQSFFRKLILSNFNNKCCITNLSFPPLLVASHIVPWSKDEQNRLNPKNGLLLNNLHDKAFDQGFITINKDFKIKISPQLIKMKSDKYLDENFFQYEEKIINIPDKYLPSDKFIEYHNDYIFKKS